MLSNEMDALDAGVRPGGLNNRLEIRILICYIVDKSSKPVPLEKVKERMHFDGIANYYETAYAIGDLLDHGNLKKQTDEYGVEVYTVTDSGSTIAKELYKTVPLTIRQETLALTNSIVNRLYNSRNNKAFKEKKDNGFLVTCSVMENGNELATVRLLVPDETTADNAIDSFLDDPTKLLISATEFLTGQIIG